MGCHELDGPGLVGAQCNNARVSDNYCEKVGKTAKKIDRVASLV